MVIQFFDARNEPANNKKNQAICLKMYTSG